MTSWRHKTSKTYLVYNFRTNCRRIARFDLKCSLTNSPIHQSQRVKVTSKKVLTAHIRNLPGQGQILKSSMLLRFSQTFFHLTHNGTRSGCFKFGNDQAETVDMATIWKFDFSLSLIMARFFQNFKMLQRSQFWVLWSHFWTVCYIFEYLNVDLEMWRSPQIIGQGQEICPKYVFSHYSENNSPRNFWFALKCRQYDCPSYGVGTIKARRSRFFARNAGMMSHNSSKF